MAADSKALPGYGGEVQGWADYRFAVEAIELKESTMQENEKKKLGPLALRLVERLAGPALQVAKKIGLQKLAEPGGVKTLLEGLETQLLPLRKQAAMELYHAGMRDGILSRQNGEPMSSYCLRREAWWTQLREMDPGIQCSDAILGEQLLQHAGLGHLETQMVRTVCQNDLSNMTTLVNTLRDQFGMIHEKESRNHKGKGRYDYKPWHQRTSYMVDNGDEAWYDEEPPQTSEQNEVYTAAATNEEEYYQEEELQTEEDPREREIEEEVVAWYATQNIDAQTCSLEDLEMVVEAVEVEIAAYYSRWQAEQRGVSIPASTTSYGTGNPQMTPQERQAKVMAAKQRSRCRACGQLGHWQRDPICPGPTSSSTSPTRKGKGKGHGKKGKGKGKSPFKGKGGSKKGDNKPRVVYFTLRDEPSTPVGYMAMRQPEDPGQDPLDDAQQRALEAEVQRLMSLPAEEVNRQLQQELAFMQPTPKAASSASLAMVPTPKSMMPTPLRNQLPEVPPMPMRSQGSMRDDDGQAASAGCKHERITRRGTNAYINMETCQDCGKVLLKEPKNHTKGDKTMMSSTPQDCTHPQEDVTWKGSNGYVWKWTCNRCGMTETHKKEPGQERPVPGRGYVASPPTTSGVSMTPQMAQIMDETVFGNQGEWNRYRELLHRMVSNHISIHGAMSQGEFLHVVNATTLCFKTFGSTMTEALAPVREPHLHQSPGARSTAFSVTTQRSDGGGISGNNKITFGKYKGYTFAAVYDMDSGYVQWCIDEKSKGEAYCTNMSRFQEYCELRLQDEPLDATGFMVMEETGDFEIGNPEDENIMMYLDSGCNTTCHGELWMKKFIAQTGYEPEWSDAPGKSLVGIGGTSSSLGTRVLYVALETLEGPKVPGEISSTEIQGSTAPLLLSLQAQQDLGMVIDLVAGIIHSRTLAVTFKAIRMPRNRLLGLRLIPGDFVDDWETIPVALMASEAEEDEGDDHQGDPRYGMVRHTEESIPVRRQDPRYGTRSILKKRFRCPRGDLWENPIGRSPGTHGVTTLEVRVRALHTDQHVKKRRQEEVKRIFQTSSERHTGMKRKKKRCLWKRKKRTRQRLRRKQKMPMRPIWETPTSTLRLRITSPLRR